MATGSDIVRDCDVGEILSGCDHHFIHFRIGSEHKLTNNMSTIPNGRKPNFNLSRELLSPATGDRLNVSYIGNAWTVFKGKLLEVEITAVPMKIGRANSAVDPLWIAVEVNRAIDLKKKKKNRIIS